MRLGGCEEFETVALVTAHDVCEYLARGSSHSPAGEHDRPARLPLFGRQPGELPTGDTWRMVEERQSGAATAHSATAIDPRAVSAAMQETAHALDRLGALHLICLAETALAVLVAEEGPEALEALLTSHGTHSAKEIIRTHLPAAVVRAVIVDEDLTKGQAHRRLTEARWLDRDTAERAGNGHRMLDASQETFVRHVRRQTERCAPEDVRAKSVHALRRVTYERMSSGRAFLTLEGPAPVLEPYHMRLQATARAVRSGAVAALVPRTGEGAGSSGADSTEAVIVDERTLDQLMFDLAALAAPATHVPLGSPNAVAAPVDARPASSRPAASDACAASTGPSHFALEKRRFRLPDPTGGAPIETLATVSIPLAGHRVRAGTPTADDAVVADGDRRRAPPQLAGAHGVRRCGAERISTERTSAEHISTERIGIGCACAGCARAVLRDGRQCTAAAPPARAVPHGG